MKNWLLLTFVFGISGLYCQAQGSDPKGIFYLKEQQFDAARSHFLDNIKNQPNDSVALIGLGETYLALKSLDSAKIMFQRVLVLNPKNPFALIGMGEISCQNNDLAGESAWFDRARRADKTNPEIYCAIAAGCINHLRQDTVTASIYLNQGLDINPKYANLHLLTGDLETCRKNYGQAINAYNRAIFFDPNSTAAYRNIGSIHLLSRSYRDALDAFKKSIAIDPGQILVYRYLGDLYYSTGKYPEAEKAYQTYMERAEVSTDDKERFAILLFFNKKYQEAATLMEQLVSINNDESILLRIKGYIAFETGDFQKGLEYMNRFFRLHDPQKVIVSDYTYYAKLLQEVGKDSLAIVNLKKAITLDPNKYEICEVLAKLSAKNKMHPEAAGYYKKMIAYGADKLVTNFLIGKEYYFEGENWRARFDSLKEMQKKEKIPFTDSVAVRMTMIRYYSQADSAFTVVNRLNGQYAGGYIWKGRIKSLLDPDAETTDAKDAYQAALAILEKSEPAKNLKSIIECYRYLGSYYFLNYERVFKSDKKLAGEMRSKTIACFTKIKELDPKDTQAKEVVKKLTGKN